jgi:arylsulfatase A-like enzyme
LIDGVDQTQLLMGGSEQGSRTTFFYQGNGVRHGRWKYLRAKHSVPGYAQDTAREQTEELYDLDADIGEAANVAAAHPKIVGELKSLLDAINQGESYPR